MRYTDIAWDFDGTLFDSYPHMLAAFQAALADYGIQDSDENICRQITVTVASAAAYYHETFGGPPPQELIAAFERYEDVVNPEQCRSLARHTGNPAPHRRKRPPQPPFYPAKRNRIVLHTTLRSEQVLHRADYSQKRLSQ